ncbi:MAG: hypothetical protein ACJA1E_002019 [Paracoccaceae bacterium]|jgi:hypothetical protein
MRDIQYAMDIAAVTSRKAVEMWVYQTCRSPFARLSGFGVLLQNLPNLRTVNALVTTKIRPHAYHIQKTRTNLTDMAGPVLTSNPKLWINARLIGK